MTEQSGVPKGYMLVPIEPTEEMCRAGESCEGSSSDKPWVGGSYTPENVEGIYKAMLAASPVAWGDERFFGDLERVRRGE